MLGLGLGLGLGWGVGWGLGWGSDWGGVAWDGVRWGGVGSAQQSTANRGHKLIGELRGGCLDDFFAGVTGIVGDPHVNIEEGIRKEHVLMDKSGVSPARVTSNSVATLMPLSPTIPAALASERTRRHSACALAWLARLAFHAYVYKQIHIHTRMYIFIYLFSRQVLGLLVDVPPLLPLSKRL